MIMNEIFKTASNEPGNTSSAGSLKEKMRAADASAKETAKPSEPDLSIDGDLDIQDLLKKYLPEFADEAKEEMSTEPAASETLETVPMFVEEIPYEEESYEEEIVEDSGFVFEDEIVDEEIPEEKPKVGFFARIRASLGGKDEEEEESVVPDTSLYDELSEEKWEDAVPEEIFEDVPEEISPVEETAAEEIPTTEEAPAEDEISDVEDIPALLAEETETEAEDVTEASPAETVEDEIDEMDEMDRNLLMGLGLEDQLDKSAGRGTADMLAAQNDEDIRRMEEEQRRAAEYEYTDRSQTPQIAEAYKSAFRASKIKLIIGLFLTVILFLYENLSLFGVQFAGALDPAVYPVVYIMMSLQLMLLACAVAYEQIFAGFRNLFTGRPTPESVTALLAVFGVVYSFYAAIVSVQGVEPIMYNFAVALCAFMSLVFSYFNTKREIFSFNIVSSKKPKYIFHRISAMDGAPESEAFGATDEDSPDVLQIRKTGFVDGYFERTTSILHSTRIYVAAMLTLVIVAAVLLAVLGFIGGKSAYEAISIAYIAVLAAVPMSMFFTYSYPFCKANKEAYENDSTIVGEASLEEYSGSAIVSFDDNNVFPSYGVKVQNIKIYNNNRIDRVLYAATSAFSVAGGPLKDVFELATMEMGHSEDVTIEGAGVGYLDCTVDGRRYTFGRYDVLRERGIELPEESAEEDSYIEGDLSIMYMLREGNLIAKMFIKYVMDADFEFILRQFTQNGTCVCIKTYDPNIDEAMIFSKIHGKKYPLKVIKNYENTAAEERMESGIVTRGTTKSLLQVVSYCDMVLSVKRTNMVISIASALVSLVILFIISLSNNLGAVGSWMIALNQLFWMIPAMLTAKLYIR